MARIRILFDGWPLVHQANSAAAIHLRTLLALRPAEIDALLALPSASETRFEFEGVESLPVEAKDLGAWQQRQLPRLARTHNANLIHTTIAGASLFARQATIISPAEYWGKQDSPSRLGQALGLGGMARAHILWPNDLPQAGIQGFQHQMPPIVHPAFFQSGKIPSQQLELPDSYLLYHGRGEKEILQKLFESWTWAAASIGEAFPLFMLGLDEQAKAFVESKLPDYHLEDYVQLVPELEWEDLIGIYQACSALIAPAPDSAWGGPMRLAMAAHKAVVAFKDEATEKMLGRSAYLVEKHDLRAFGAATITVVVDEKVWEQLEEAADKGSRAWKADQFTEALGKLYRDIV